MIALNNINLQIHQQNNSNRKILQKIFHKSNKLIV